MSLRQSRLRRLGADDSGGGGGTVDLTGYVVMNGAAVTNVHGVGQWIEGSTHAATSGAVPMLALRPYHGADGEVQVYQETSGQFAILRVHNGAANFGSTSDDGLSIQVGGNVGVPLAYINTDGPNMLGLQFLHHNAVIASFWRGAANTFSAFVVSPRSFPDPQTHNPDGRTSPMQVHAIGDTSQIFVLPLSGSAGPKTTYAQRIGLSQASGAFMSVNYDVAAGGVQDDATAYSVALVLDPVTGDAKFRRAAPGGALADFTPSWAGGGGLPSGLTFDGTHNILTFGESLPGSWTFPFDDALRISGPLALLTLNSYGHQLGVFQDGATSWLNGTDDIRFVVSGNEIFQLMKSGGPNGQIIVHRAFDCVLHNVWGGQSPGDELHLKGTTADDPANPSHSGRVCIGSNNDLIVDNQYTGPNGQASILLTAEGNTDAAATDGFVWLPTCNGPPTGTPSHVPTGKIALIIDNTASPPKPYGYFGGAWHALV